jgi:hypothetical protein
MAPPLPESSDLPENLSKKEHVSSSMATASRVPIRVVRPAAVRIRRRKIRKLARHKIATAAAAAGPEQEQLPVIGQGKCGVERRLGKLTCQC